MPLLDNGAFKLEGATEAPLKIGEKALNFTRQNQDNQTISLSDFAGRPVVLYLVGRATNELTRSKFDKLVALSPRLAAAGAAVVCLSTNYWEENKRLAQETGATFPILDDQSVGFEAVATYEQPTDAGTAYPVYVIGGDGTIRWENHNDDLFDEAPAELLLTELGRVAGLNATPPARPTTPPRIPAV